MARRKGTGRSAERERYWRGHVKAQQRSGESIRGYCRAQGLSEALFHYWKRALKRREEAGCKLTAEAGAPRFAEVKVSMEPGASIEIAWGEVLRVRVHAGFDEETLARVLSVLERKGC